MIENISFGKDAAYLYAAMNYNFFIKKESDKSGKSPIYLNVRLNGKRARISTLLKIEEKHWDKEKKKVIKCDEADDYNLILKQLENIKEYSISSNTPKYQALFQISICFGSTNTDPI